MMGYLHPCENCDMGGWVWSIYNSKTRTYRILRPQDIAEQPPAPFFRLDFVPGLEHPSREKCPECQGRGYWEAATKPTQKIVVRELKE